MKCRYTKEERKDFCDEKKASRSCFPPKPEELAIPSQYMEFVDLCDGLILDEKDIVEVTALQEALRNITKEQLDDLTCTQNNVDGVRCIIRKAHKADHDFNQSSMFIFTCGGCGTEHKKSAYCIAQNAMGHSVDFTCPICREITTLPGGQ